LIFKSLIWYTEKTHDTVFLIKGAEENEDASRPHKESSPHFVSPYFCYSWSFSHD
jgi:hypothetical protein